MTTDELTQVLPEEAFYVYRTGGKVWINTPQCGQLTQLSEVSKGSRSAHWIVGHTELYNKGINGPLNYWVE